MAMQMMNNLKVAKMAPNISCKTNPRQNITNKLAMHKGKNKNNFYEVLSLGSNNVGFEEIKKAYRRMARELHPDVCPSSMKEESTRRFVEIQKAYETLSDPIARNMYDYEMGLADSLGLRQEIFPKEVWEKQLNGLKQRCRIRMEKKNI